MRQIAQQIEQDQQTLSDLMNRMGINQEPGQAGHHMALEKVGRVKLTGPTAGGAEVGMFTSLETLSLGVEGKASMWRILKAVEDRYPALDRGQIDALIARAETRRDLLEAERCTAGRLALGNQNSP